jgi:hypothetical protein
VFRANAVYDAVALIQSSFSTAGTSPGNLEVIAHTGDHLDHYWREDRGPFTCQGPFGIPGPAAPDRTPVTKQEEERIAPPLAVPVLATWTGRPAGHGKADAASSGTVGYSRPGHRSQRCRRWRGLRSLKRR